MLKKIIQVAFLFIGGALGLYLLPPLYEFMNLSSHPWLNSPYFSVAIGAALLFVLSFALSDYFVKLITWSEEVLFKLPIADLLFGTFGLIVGLSVATLAGVAISQMNIPIIAAVVPAIMSIVLGYLGFRLGFTKREELLQMFSGKASKKRGEANGKDPDTQDHYKLLDTSVIIDGRIADISATGFVEGVLVVPQFVLTELQHIADSSDTLKRTRGRRGLDILKRLQDERVSTVLITEIDFEDVSEVDLKLVRLAKKWTPKF